MPATPHLVTDRLALDPLTTDDILAIFEIAREKESIEDYQYAARSLDEVRAWLEPSIADEASLLWVIRKQERAIGLFEIVFEAEYSDWETHVCRVGYFVDHQAQSQGYATEALLAVVDWLFRCTDVERIEAGVTLHNVPSYRTLEKAGFIRDRIVKRNWQWYDQVYDSVYYYLHRPSKA
ncbi:MAG: GNAT family N-acetyltransferase [Anaerolineae bacterium]